MKVLVLKMHTWCKADKISSIKEYKAKMHVSHHASISNTMSLVARGTDIMLVLYGLISIGTNVNECYIRIETNR